jgi:hypothetical protein
MAGTAVVRWNYPAVDELLNSLDGPVGRLIAELSGRAASIARRRVHVRPGTPGSTVWNEATSTAWPPGYTRASIRTHLARGARTGKLYGGVNASGSPTFFLEYPPRGAEQMTDRYPFLTTALDELAGTAGLL